MNADPVRAIARSVLYEGYLLWPYRRTAAKNRHRFTLGGLYPLEYAATSADRGAARVDVLVEGEHPRIDAELRFLRLWRRQAMLHGTPVDEMTVDGERYVSWEDATEECVALNGVCALAGADTRIDRPARDEDEVLDDRSVLRRSAQPLCGRFTLDVTPVDRGLHRVTATVTNLAAWDGPSRDDALRGSLLAAHVVLRAHDAAFVSAIDPPDALREHAAASRSDGLWPVLVGTPGDRSTILASPMILEDYPRVAPESAGDYFDGGEVDALLVHSIRALTDDEQREIRATDPRARELLDRTLSLPDAELARLHGGAVRESGP